jgi:hypothetical protein
MVVVAALLTWHFWPASTSPPYPPSAVHARVSLRVVAPAHAQAEADRLTGPGRLNVVYPVGDSPKQVLLGQLSLRTPRNAPADGEYVFILIDNDRHAPLPDLYAAAREPDSNVGQGWDGRYVQIAKRYPRLSAVAAPADTGSIGAVESGMAVFFTPRTHGPVTFTGVLPFDARPVTDIANRFTAVLALFGRNESLYWATVLPL